MADGLQSLADALGVKPREVVAFIGAGGKTTAMYCVAEELAARGLKVIVTTTTKIFPPDRKDITLIVEARAGEALASRAAEALGRVNAVAVVTRLLPDGKLEGIPSAGVAVLWQLPDVAAVLVEADGSARKPFKAPAAHEPVIPEETTLLVAVAGADALGQPLTADLVHRPELAAQQAGIRVGSSLTPEAAARIILGPANLGGKPARARLAALITRARTPALREAARHLAELLRAGGAAPVVIAELVAEPNFVTVMA